GDDARRLLREAAALQRRQGGDPAELARTLLALSAAVLDHGDEAESVALAREAVRRLDPAQGGEDALSIRAARQRPRWRGAHAVASRPRGAAQDIQSAQPSGVGHAGRTRSDPGIARRTERGAAELPGVVVHHAGLGCP